MTSAQMLLRLDRHYASMSDADGQEIAARAVEGEDMGSLAIRTCACGVRIDGFYEYLDHLKQVLAGDA